MLRGYLKVRDACPVCSEALHHQRADDGPAYMTILIVGHLLAPLLLIVYTKWRPDPVTMAVCFTLGTVALSPRGDWRMPSDASATGWLSK